MSQATAGRWVRLRDGERFIGDLWPDSDQAQRHATLISMLWSGNVRLRSYMTAIPGELQPTLATLKNRSFLRTRRPLPGIEGILLSADPRTINCDIPAGRIVVSGFVTNDDAGRWAPFFPGWLRSAAGRSIVVEMDDIEFDGSAARAYVVENLLPNHATPSDGAASPRPIDSGVPPTDGNVIPLPYRTGLAGRPTSWDLVEVECRRRYAAGERYPGKLGESRAEWAQVLINWLKSMHDGAPVPEQKTLTNRLGSLLRELATGPLSPPC